MPEQQITSRKKVLVLTSTYPRWRNDSEPGFVQKLSAQLTKGFEVYVLAPHCLNSLPQESFGDEIQIYRFRYAPSRWEKLAYNGGVLENLKRNRLLYFLVPFFILCQLYSAWQLHRKHGFDCIHAHWIIPQGLIAVLVRIFSWRKPKVLITSHGADLFALKGWLLGRLKRWILKRSDHLTVVSSVMRQKAIELGCLESRVSIDSMGVDLQTHFKCDSDQRIHRDSNKLIFVGRLVEKKGVSVLLDAFATLVANRPTLKLDIIGDGPEKPNLEAQASQLGIISKVAFCGWMKNDEIPERLKASLIAVVPSVVAKSGDQEGLGLVVIEAIGCGCAVVASDLPAIKDVIEDGKTGLLAKSGCAKSFADRIETLLDAPDLAKALIENGRIYVSKRYDWESVGERYTRTIQNLISSRVG